LTKKIFVLRHVPHENLGTLAAVFKRAGLPYAYLDVWKKSARFPSPAHLRALVIMGGPMGVYETAKHPFLRKELSFIKKYLRTGRPALGICLGAQLIARALGGRVYPNRWKEIGWYPLTLTKEGRQDPFFSRFPRRSQVFQWHGDTFDLPGKTALLARSPLCRHQGFRYRDNGYGLQFHLEVDTALVREWLRQPGAHWEVGQAGPGAYGKLVKGLPLHMPRLKKTAAAFFRPFAARIKT
jgi:GMP synthase (glutamine-hydrolysing)